jgi:hypothetical protein
MGEADVREVKPSYSAGESESKQPETPLEVEIGISQSKQIVKLQGQAVGELKVRRFRDTRFACVA